MTETPSPVDKDSPASTVKLRGCLLLSFGSLLLLILAIGSFLYWFEHSFRRGRESYTRSQIGTNSLFDPDPGVLQELVADTENAEKITTVRIGELSGPHFTAEQFQALKKLPRLKTVDVMYVDKGDPVLANIQGMASIDNLSFYHAGVTKEGTRYLSSFPNLTLLSIDRVDDEMLVDIEKLQKALPNCTIYYRKLNENEREYDERIKRNYR